MLTKYTRRRANFCALGNSLDLMLVFYCTPLLSSRYRLSTELSSTVLSSSVRSSTALSRAALSSTVLSRKVGWGQRHMADTRTDRHRQDRVVCIVQYTLYTVYTVCIVQYTVCSATCAVGSVYFEVYSVQCATCRLHAVSIWHCEVCRVCYVQRNHDIRPF